MAATAIVLTTVLFGFASLRVDRHQQNHVLLATIASESSHPRVGALGALEPSLVFYGRRPITKLVREHRAKPADWKRRHQSWSPSGTPRELTDVATFLAGDPQAFVITTDRYYREIESQLPESVAVLVDAPYFMKKHRLVLLGHERPLSIADGRPAGAVRK
jgi:hypothetical protein